MWRIMDLDRKTNEDMIIKKLKDLKLDHLVIEKKQLGFLNDNLEERQIVIECHSGKNTEMIPLREYLEYEDLKLGQDLNF